MRSCDLGPTQGVPQRHHVRRERLNGTQTQTDTNRHHSSGDGHALSAVRHTRCGRGGGVGGFFWHGVLHGSCLVHAMIGSNERKITHHTLHPAPYLCTTPARKQPVPLQVFHEATHMHTCRTKGAATTHMHAF